MHRTSLSSKFIWNYLYLVVILSLICNHLRTYFLQLEHRISSSVKPSISGQLHLKMPRGSVVYTYSCSLTLFSIFHGNCNIWSHFFFIIKCFVNCSNSLVPLSFLLHYYVAIKSKEYMEAMNSYHKIIISENVAMKVTFTCLLIWRLTSVFIIFSKALKSFTLKISEWSKYFSHNFSPVCLN